jgi:thiol-disulfide isomerase/thioredoxin
LPESGFGQTIIRGTAPAYAGSTISIRDYHNYITYATKQLTSSRIGRDGAFELRLDEPHAEVLLLAMEYMELSFYAIGGEVYDVKIEEFDLPTTYPKLTIVKGPAGDLNKIVPEFDDTLLSLTDDYYPYIVKNIKRNLVDSVFDSFGARSKKNAGPFMQLHVDYKLALVKQITNKKRVSQFEKEYIIDRPVREAHITYVQFISQYFSNSLSLLGAESQGKMLGQLINTKKDVQGVLALLARDERLANDTLRELVLLNGLYELYGAAGYKEESVLDLLDSLAAKTKIDAHVEMARNIRNSLSHLRKGTIAPDFELLDAHGVKKKLSDFEGKHLYLTFWAHTCPPCSKEIGVLVDIAEKYGDQVAFVNISLGKEETKMKEFLSRSDPAEELWHDLVSKESETIRAAYKIESLPSFVLIDTAGRILKAPAEPPSGNIEKTFSNILLEKDDKPTITDPGGR